MNKKNRTERQELMALRVLYGMAMEGIAHRDAEYAALDAFCREQQGVINRIADALHECDLILRSYVEIKDEAFKKIKPLRTKRKPGSAATKRGNIP
ncbi:MAG: hypothetical protein LBO00_01725 [Zoogloeaceae bacterium]|jgi:hypothetical protein|nr:hypothetical protein [Zoogloeaceae bacterium]